MYKLVSNVKGSKWRLLNGIKVLDGDVLILDKFDLRLYDLIDEDGNKIDVNKNDLLVKLN